MIGIIGGSGLEKLDLFEDAKEVEIKSKYGKHSPIKTGKINGIDVAVLSRHGYSHENSPSKVNYRANIWALKELGCKCIIASSACGSLREEIEPGHLVLPDQFIDRTWNREVTYFDEEKVSHISMSEPFSKKLRNILIQNGIKNNFPVHNNKTLIVIEGPRFSTRAESRMFRSWGADVINMTTIPEAILAKELGIEYQVLCMSTDYDAWHEDRESVTYEMVLDVMKKNSQNVTKIFLDSLEEISKLE